MRKVLLLVGVSLGLVSAGLAKPPITDGETDSVLVDLDPYMIEALRGSGGKKGGEGRWKEDGSIVQLMNEAPFRKLVDKHDLLVFNGPMVGDVSADSAKIWVRTAGAASVQVLAGDHKSTIVNTTAASDFTGVVTLDGLAPLTEYGYELIVNDTVVKKDYFCFQTAPKPGQPAKFSMTFGSGARYVPKNEGIWRVMSQTRPLAYLGLGDNVYIDDTYRQNVQRLHYYRRMLRQEYRELLAGTAIYAVWDDHDMSVDDSEGGYGLKEPWKIANLKVFQQNWNNPHYGVPQARATYHSFRMGDVEVFMTDGRFYRYGSKSIKRKKAGGPDMPTTMLGEVQLKWLLNGLKNSTATFKVLASGTMWHDLADKGGVDSWAGADFRAERDQIFDLINREKINGVVLISGDRHRTDIWKTERPKGYPLYEFLSAKLTNMHGHGARKEALWSYSTGTGKNEDTGERFWGQLDFDTTTKDPTVTFKAVNHTGKLIKAFPLKLSELTH